MFTWAWQRHLHRHRCADYEVCGNPICWLVWRLEWALWYRCGREERPE